MSCWTRFRLKKQGQKHVFLHARVWQTITHSNHANVVYCLLHDSLANILPPTPQNTRSQLQQDFSPSPTRQLLNANNACYNEALSQVTPWFEEVSDWLQTEDTFERCIIMASWRMPESDNYPCLWVLAVWMTVCRIYIIDRPVIADLSKFQGLWKMRTERWQNNKARQSQR